MGVDASYIGGELRVRLRVGLLRLQLLPPPAKKAAGSGQGKEKKEGKSRPKREKKKSGMKLRAGDILDIAGIALKALGRFRRCLYLRELMLHLTVASDDPYDTAVRYGYINTALGTLLPLFRRAFRVGHEDIGVAMSFESEKMSADARLEATLRIGQILRIAICAGWAFLIWRGKIKKRTRARETELGSEKG